MKSFKNYFLISFFLIFLLLLGSMTQLNVREISKNEKPENIKTRGLIEKNNALKKANLEKEDRFAQNFFGKLFFVEHYGGIQKKMHKHLVDDPIPARKVYKGSDGMLYYVIPEKDIYKNSIENVKSLKDYLDRNNIKFSFVIAPNKHSINSNYFPYGVLDYSNTDSNDFFKSLNEIGVNTLNLNFEYYKEHKDDKKSFYMTDTHWKNETAFWGYQKTVEFLSQTHNFKYENKNNSNNIQNYSIEKFNDTYIGSMGKRTGRYYIDKKDDYTLILPSFETSYNYKKFDQNYNLITEKSGNFEKVFVNRDILNSNEPYIDKYTTMMDYGTAYEIITNNNVKDNSSVMILKDSFAMPLSAYLSTNVHTIYLVDTREKNIRETLKNTINSVKPDQLLFLCSPTTVFYYPDMFDFKF